LLGGIVEGLLAYRHRANRCGHNRGVRHETDTVGVEGRDGVPDAGGGRIVADSANTSRGKCRGAGGGRQGSWRGSD